MADEIDRANDLAEAWNAHMIARHHGDIPKGEPGECDWCGEHTPRKVNGYCARCRDEMRLE